MSEQSATNRWLVVAVCGAGLAIVVLYARGPEQGSQRESLDAAKKVAAVPANDLVPPPSADIVTANDPGPSSDPPVDLPAPYHSIAESGRLSIDSESLREGEVLTIALALADDAHGDEELAVRVVSLDGRTLDVTAMPMDGMGAGVQIAIDADWLQPGSYMIQVKTTEKTPLPLRRYVLEVR
jgi:hypothetical protein